MLKHHALLGCRMLAPAALCLLLAGTAAAQEAEHETGHETNAEHGARHAIEHPDMLAIFLGNTHENASEHGNPDGFTWGVEYSHEFSHAIGAAVIVERAQGDVQATLALAVLELFPWKGLEVFVGGGVEWKDAGEAEHGAEHRFGRLDTSSSQQEQEATTRAVVRLGVGYGVHLGRMVIVPQLNLDLIGREEALVAGATVGYVF